MKPYQLSLLAQGCGDAYGATYEFMPASKIPESLPGKSIGGGPFGFLPGEITDDTDMAIITLEHLKKYKIVQPEVLKKAYRAWAVTSKDVGAQISNALLNNSYNPQGQGNGALMRVIPAILFMRDEFGYDLHKTKDEISVISKTTHINDEVQLINNLFIDKIYGVYEDAYYHQVLTKIHTTKESTGWVFNSARIVLEVLSQSIGFLDGFRTCIRYGGDTDTHCAIYGAFLGSFKDIRKELDINDFLNKASIDVILSV